MIEEPAHVPHVRWVDVDSEACLPRGEHFADHQQVVHLPSVVDHLPAARLLRGEHLAGILAHELTRGYQVSCKHAPSFPRDLFEEHGLTDPLLDDAGGATAAAAALLTALPHVGSVSSRQSSVLDEAT
eukprot:CAMPEP_0118925710 /NCGR_PEP_ID=MMETSP1169-20130426/3555_1 /TAXON_ID=36882 /ORGANISM="Pyramimonas obovata, Strain CCMP722" /LENGTH=127 /DNA_ID=CAMNT_0006867085 /DNA_START=274 /DNA_END=657 /DNA_ORIENTATION=+